MYFATDQYVCSNCFDDPGLCEFIKNHSSADKCSFCNRRSKKPIGAPLDSVIDHMRECIRLEYDEAVNLLPYETAEGGYQGTHWETYDLLIDELQISLPLDYNNRLLEALCDGIGETDWCEAHPFSLNSDQFAEVSWDRFCETVKHERRFFFSSYGKHSKYDDTPLPGETLKTILKYAQDAGLFANMPKGTQLYRARYQKPGQKLKTAEELGPPPKDRAIQSNRMSPPGIVMLYASDNSQTALIETATNPGTFVVGRFKTKRDALILNLANLPPIPTLFDELSDTIEYNPRPVLKFLHHVTWEMSQPIARDKRIHVEYIPTQIVTEYIRSHAKYLARNIEGIKYPSSVHRGHASFVIFATQDNIVKSKKSSLTIPRINDDRWIELVATSEHHIKK